MLDIITGDVNPVLILSGWRHVRHPDLVIILYETIQLFQRCNSIKLVKSKINNVNNVIIIFFAHYHEGNPAVQDKN